MAGNKPEEQLSSLQKFSAVGLKMLSAGLAASIAETVTIPIDTTKVRLQIQGETIQTAGSSLEKRYTGMIQCIFAVAKEEGVRNLYKGLVAGIHRQMCFCGVRIGLYDQVKRFYGDTGEHGNKPKVITKILASCTTATTAVVFFQPTEVVKIRFQASGAKSVYSGTMNAYATIGRVEGFKGLWKGVSPNVLRLSVVNCTEIVVYDIIKSYILYKQWMGDTVNCHFTSAICAGFVTTVVASPVDVVKTRFMNSGPGQYKGPFHCAVMTMKENGPTAFYKGFIPNFTRLGIWNIAMFLSYEQIKRLFKVAD